MKNLKLLSEKKEKVSLNDMMFMTKMISLEFNKVFSDSDMAKKIKEIFDVDCTEKDLISFREVHKLHEDYELENRKIIEYGSQIRY